MQPLDSTELYTLILKMEQKGLVKRTFRRLDPDRQQKVILAILEEAGEKGPADINIKRVAERAGVSIGSLYQYFGDRRGLLNFAIELVVTLTVEMFNAYRPYLCDLPLRQALELYITGGFEWTEQQRGFARFFAAAAYQGDPQVVERVVHPIASSLKAMIDDILAAAAARGELRPGLDLDAASRVINALLIATGDGLMMPNLNIYYQLSDANMAQERLLQAVLDLITHGIQTEEHTA